MKLIILHVIIGILAVIACNSVLASEYTAPCDAGARLDGDVNYSICGNGVMINVTQQFKNISYILAPFTPNVAAINTSTAGGYINSKISVNVATNKQCNMLWFRADNITRGVIIGISGDTLAFGFKHSDYACGGNTSLSVMNSDGGGGKLYCNFSTSVNASQWYTLMIEAQFSGTYGSPSRTNVTAWINGNLWFNISNWYNNAFVGGYDTVELGGVRTGSNNALIGQLDHYVNFNGSCNSSMISDYNAYFTTSTNVLNLILRNESLQGQNLTSMSQSKNYYFGANYTDVSGSSITGGNCSISISNVTAHFPFKSSNFTLSNSNFINFSVSEASQSVESDTLNFRVCKSVGGLSVNILFNGSLLKTVNNSVIPLCSVGSHQEFFYTTLLSNSSGVNITLVCNGCTPSQNAVIISNISSGNIFEFSRLLSYHNESLSYNASNSLYEFKTHLYKWSKSGVGISFAQLQCNSDFQNSSLNISGVNNSISIQSINDVAYTQFMSFESNFTLEILLESFGLTPTSTISFNVTYSNGTLIKTSTGEFMNLSNLELNKAGVYNITAFVIDSNDGTSWVKGNFNITESVKPIITWVTPFDDNSSVMYYNESEFLKLSFYDVNLFAYEILVYDSSQTLKFNFTLLNINNSNTSTSELITLSKLGVWVVNATASDSHTIDAIGSYDISSKDDELKIVVNKVFEREEFSNNVTIKYISPFAISNFNYSKKVDRYNFGMSINADKSLSEVTQSFLVSCSEIVFIPNSKFIGHFVCYNDRIWIDFNNENVKRWNVKRVDENSFQINLVTPNLKRLDFESIGGLNFVQSQKYFTVIERTPSHFSIFNFNLDTFSNVFLLFTLIIFYLGCMIIGFTYKNLGFTSLGFFIGVFIGFMLLNVHIILVAAVFLLNIIIYFTTSKF